MNYSASEDYHQKCEALDKKRIQPRQIRKRWFRNWYVLYQPDGWFRHNTIVVPFFATRDYLDRFPQGTWYGPFWSEKEAQLFGDRLTKTHETFVLG
jgi:hypothetical protein